ncbi:hypothetical protein [Amycolatopsis japonica]|uniref:hypothetical protein n=1 Tax=Amycolatopsis japonica TaxID=208439 RepID=UPI0033E73FA2
MPARKDDLPDAKVRESVLRVLKNRLADDWRGSALELDLTGARFSDQAVLQLEAQRSLRLDHAVFEDGLFTVGPANAYAVSYVGATFRGPETRFELGGVFAEAQFTGQLVFDTDRLWRRFTFTDCVFTEATIVVTGEGTQTSLVTFTGCTFDECFFDFSGLIELRGTGVLVISSSTLRKGKIDLRGRDVGGLALWLRESKLEGMSFEVDPMDDGLPGKMIALDGVELAETEVPDAHVASRDPWATGPA